MSYIQQSGAGGGGTEVQHANVITGTYEVQLDDQVDQKSAADVIILDQQQQGQHDTTNNSLDNGQSASGNAIVDPRFQERTGRPKSQSSTMMAHERTPHSNRFPPLKQYFTFGPWVGRNRKAQCMACQHQSCSSQPDRLLKHLKKCVALSDEDRQVVEDMMNERSANKRKRASYGARCSDNEADSPYYEDNDNHHSSMNSGDGRASLVPLVMGKRVKREHTDRKTYVDECLTKFIMVNRIPLKSIHSKEFVEFVRALDPDYKLPTRDHITTVLIPGLLNII